MLLHFTSKSSKYLISKGFLVTKKAYYDKITSESKKQSF